MRTEGTLANDPAALTEPARADNTVISGDGGPSTGMNLGG